MTAGERRPDEESRDTDRGGPFPGPGQYLPPGPELRPIAPTPIGPMAEPPDPPGGDWAPGASYGMGERRSRRGLWIALAVVALVAVVAVVWAVLAARPAPRPTVIDQATTLTVKQLETGDCLDALPDPGTVTQVTVVPCGQFHPAQVVASVELSGDYTTDVDLSEKVSVHCEKAAAPALARAEELPEAKTVGVTYFYPSAESWAQNDRTGLCLVYSSDGAITGSLLD